MDSSCFVKLVARIQCSCVSEDVFKQAKVAKVICKLMRKRLKLQEDCETNGLPGASFLDLFFRLQQLLGVATSS